MHRSPPIIVWLVLVSLVPWVAPSTLHLQAHGQNRRPVASTIQLPTFGVSIDAQGELRGRRVEDVNGLLLAERLAAAQRSLPADVRKRSALRKISLRGLEREIQKSIAAGRPVAETVQALAGLLRVEYLFCFPDRSDIVIAGPAEGWLVDPFERRLGLTTGRPVITLDDLRVALRTFADLDGGEFVGCTIDPTAEGLANQQRFQKSIPPAVAEEDRGIVAERVARGIPESLGAAQIRVFGVPADTHLAQVMVEADYRMKCSALGLEPLPVPIRSYFEGLRGAKSPAVQRWWFTPNYRCLTVSADELAVQLSGEGVQLDTENARIAPAGKLVLASAPANPAAETFARNFTDKYPDIAARSPVYAQLRTVVDLLVVSAACREFRFYERAEWNPERFLDDRNAPVARVTTPRTAPCVANVAWKENRLIAVAGGGVAIEPRKALAMEHRIETGALELAQRHAGLAAAPVDRWWWD